MTEGEKLFTKYCVDNKLEIEKIEEIQEVKTPDYKLFLDINHFIIVEVKDLEDNPDDIKAVECFKNNNFAVWGNSKVGARIRNKIDDAKNQLKQFSDLKKITILLIVDNRNIMVPEISDYEIAVGMYGIEKRIIDNTKVIRKFGGNKRMTDNQKRYISYIGILKNAKQIDLYENYYASHKLSDSNVLKIKNMSLYKLNINPRIKFGHWIKYN